MRALTSTSTMVMSVPKHVGIELVNECPGKGSSSFAGLLSSVLWNYATELQGVDPSAIL